AHSGHRSPLSQTQLEPSGAGSPDLPVPAARRGNPAAQPRLEHRYYLHSDAGRVSLPGRGNGLVQPIRSQLGTFNTMETGFCLAALDAAFRFGQPEIWNSD